MKRQDRSKKKPKRVYRRRAEAGAWLTKDEVSRIVTTVEQHNVDQPERGERDRLIVRLTYRCGLRIGECLDIVPASFDRDGTLHVQRSKGSKPTVTTLEADLIAEVREYIAARDLAKDDLLFPISKQAFNWSFERYCEKAGIDRKKSNPHSLRHGFCQHMIRGGASITQLQRAVGHTSISSTGRYTEATNAEANEAMQRIFGTQG